MPTQTAIPENLLVSFKSYDDILWKDGIKAIALVTCNDEDLTQVKALIKDLSVVRDHLRAISVTKPKELLTMPPMGGILEPYQMLIASGKDAEGNIHQHTPTYVIEALLRLEQLDILTACGITAGMTHASFLMVVNSIASGHGFDDLFDD